jgi:hypothetical protein
MSNENELATEFAKELAKQLPVKEALSAPARQTGQILEDLVKTIQLALVPFQLAGALQDRLRHFIDRAIRPVPEEQRISPAPQILGPIIEAIRYEPEGTDLDQMFSALLSTSMDQFRVADGHPAFPGIIRAISPDEAKILKSLQTARIKLDIKHGPSPNFRPYAVFKTTPVSGLAFESNFLVYLDHLEQLGLVSTGRQLVTAREIDLTPWGRLFMRAVTPSREAN